MNQDDEYFLLSRQQIAGWLNTDKETIHSKRWLIGYSDSQKAVQDAPRENFCSQRKKISDANTKKRKKSLLPKSLQLH